MSPVFEFPDFPVEFTVTILVFFPLPHQQGSFLPIFFSIMFYPLSERGTTDPIFCLPLKFI